MPIKGDKGSNLNQVAEIGAKDTQRTVDAWPELDPNRPADAQTTGRQSRAGASPGRGSSRGEWPHDRSDRANAANMPPPRQTASPPSASPETAGDEGPDDAPGRPKDKP